MSAELQTENSPKPEIQMHPDFQTLIERYRTDPRFEGKEQERQVCINTLNRLNEFVQMMSLPEGIGGVILGGSLSYEGKMPRFKEDGQLASDIDLLFVHNAITKIGKHDIPAHHPADLSDYIWGQAKQLGFFDLLKDNYGNGPGIEVHFFHGQRGIFNRDIRDDVSKHMMQTGTLIRGTVPYDDYGIYRNGNAPKYVIPDHEMGSLMVSK